MALLLQINSTKNAGSTGRIAEGIGENVLNHGWQSIIAYGRAVNPGMSQPLKIGKITDKFLHVAGTRLFDNHGFYSSNATRILIRQIELLKPDLIHLHNLHGYFINVKILFEYLKGFSGPIVWTIHDCWPFTGHCCHYERIKCTKWQVECHDCELKWLYPQSYFTDNSKINFLRKKGLFTSPHNLNLVTVSRWLESQVMLSYLKDLPVRTIYNGINLDIFRPGTREVENLPGLRDKRIILGVANIWTDGKGLDSFIRLSQIIDNNYHIVLIGLTNKQIRSLPPNITGFPRTASSEELADFYNMADVFVNPSIAETFGVVTAEALACGTPVAAYRCSSLPELVDDRVGRLADAGDLEGLYRCIKEILSIGKSDFTVHCRAKAEYLFDRKSQFDQYFNLYQVLLKP